MKTGQNTTPSMRSWRSQTRIQIQIFIKQGDIWCSRSLFSINSSSSVHATLVASWLWLVWWIWSSLGSFVYRPVVAVGSHPLARKCLSPQSGVDSCLTSAGMVHACSLDMVPVAIHCTGFVSLWCVPFGSSVWFDIIRIPSMINRVHVRHRVPSW